MQAPGASALQKQQQQAATRKGLKRQTKGARVHQAQEIALMIGNTGFGNEHQMVEQTAAGDLGAYGGHSFHPGPQSSSMPLLQQVNSSAQQQQQQHQSQMQMHQQPLSIQSPMGHFHFQQPQQPQPVHPQTTTANKMFQRGGGGAYQQQQQHMVPMNKSMSTHTTKAAAKANSLLQQQLLEQQQYGGGGGGVQQLNPPPRHGNHLSHMHAANQKIFYPMVGQGQTSKSSRSRTQLSCNSGMISSNNQHHQQTNFQHHQQQQLQLQPQPQYGIQPLMGSQGEMVSQQFHHPGNAGQVDNVQAAATGVGGGHNNLMMRQCTSATLTRPKRNGANTATNTTMQHQQNPAAQQRNVRKQRQQPPPQINNLMNTSLHLQQKRDLRGSTKHISRPLTSLQHQVPPLISVTPQGAGAYAIAPANLNATTLSDHGHAFATQQQQHHQTGGVIKSSRSNQRKTPQNHQVAVGGAGHITYGSKHAAAQSRLIESPSKHPHGQKLRKADNSSGQKKAAINTPKNLLKSPPSHMQPSTNSGKHAAPSDSTSRKMLLSSARTTNPTVVSSILTVTVLEAKLKVDMSTFLAKMQVYCQVTLQTLGSLPVETKVLPPQKRSKSTNQIEDSRQKQQPVILESLVKKTATLTGKEPKWSECFVFDLKGASEYLLEISVWSTNYLVSDSCLGRAFLKFDGSHSETGSITNWLALKTDSGGNGGVAENGEVFVSISKEAILPKASGRDNNYQQSLYKHLVQNTEECAAISGDLDDHQTYLQEGDHSQNHLAPQEILHGNTMQRQRQQHQQLGRDETEVNSAEDEDPHVEEFTNLNEDSAPDEGLESPVDDIILEEEQHHIEQQRLLLAYQTQQNNKMFLSNNNNNVVNKQHQLLYQQQQQSTSHFQQQKYSMNTAGAPMVDGEITEDGELDEQLKTVNHLHHHGGHGRQEGGESEDENGLQSQDYQYNNRAGMHHVVDPTDLVAVQQLQHYANQQQQQQQQQQLHQQPVGQQAKMAAASQALYHTGGFMKQQNHFEQLSNDEDDDDAGEDPVDDSQLHDNDEDDQSNEDGGQYGQEEEEDGDNEDSVMIDDPERQADGTAYEQGHFQQQHHLVGINPNLLMQMQQQNAADELIDLQKDIVEENARLRQEVVSIDKIQKKIERQNKSIKREKSSLKQLQGKLRSKSKRLEAQQEELVYKRQQIEKESIRVNKTMQKMRRMKQTLDQTLGLCSSLVKSEIFSKLRYEASLTQHNSQHDTSDDWLLAMQAQEFVTNFDKVTQLLEHVANDTALQGMATGSGDLNNKSQGGATTIQTTQHQQHNSQSSFQTQGALSQNVVQKQPSQQLYQKPNIGGPNGKSQQFMSDDTSICGDRNMLAGISQSPFNEQKHTQLRLPKEKSLLQQSQNGEPQNTDNYWTHSSIREIRATGQASLLIAKGGTGLESRGAGDDSTPHLPYQKHNNAPDLQFGQYEPWQNGNRSNSLNSKLPVVQDNISSQNVSRGGAQQFLPAPAQALAPNQASESGKPSQSTVMSPSRTQKPNEMYHHQQSRFHTEVNDTTSQLGGQPQMTQEQLDARQLYERHLNVDIGGVGLLEDDDERASQINMRNEEEAKVVMQRNESAQSGVQQQRNQQDQMQHNSQHQHLMAAAQKQQSQHEDTTNNSRSGKTQNSRTEQTITSGGGSNFLRNQEIQYNDLIVQMSKELNDIQLIKQNLLQMHGSSLPIVGHSELIDQESQISVGREQDNNNDESRVGGGGLEQEQMQFLLEQQSATSQVRDQHQQDNSQLSGIRTASDVEVGNGITQDGLSHHHQQEGHDTMGEEEQAEDDKQEVEGYIWESMQRNAERMLQLKSEKGIQDPVELERELLRNFQTQEHVGGSHDNSAISPYQGEPVQDEQKFTSSYIIDTQQQQNQQLVGNPAQQTAVEVEEEEDEFEFKFDPDFLNKINANMALNDQVFESRQDNQATTTEVESSPQQQPQQQQQQPPQPQQLIMQSTLQGEQVSQQQPGGFEAQDGSDAGSFESREEVHDGPSFVMDYSNNQDLRQSQATLEHSQTNSQRPSAGMFMLHGGATTAEQNQEAAFAVAADSHAQTNSNSNGTGSGGAAPATLAVDVPIDDGFNSPKATHCQNLLSSRESQKGSVILPNSGGSDGHYSKERMINTVEKLDRKDDGDYDAFPATEKAQGEAQLQRPTDNAEFLGVDQQQMTANDFEISNRQSVRGHNEQEDEILKLINESYLEEKDNRNMSVIYKDDKVYDQPKRAVYGIQPVKEEAKPE